MDVKALMESIPRWIEEKVQESGGRGVLFGLSGGLDSAVAAALCRRAFPKNQCWGIFMPCNSERQDRQDALRVAEALDIHWQEVPLDNTFSSLMLALERIEVERNQKLAVANIKPRLRMTVLYYIAAARGFRVIGTSNRSEMEVGYFTKYGDGGVDLLPLADVLKKEVREMAPLLGVPQDIIEKKPSGGLWEGQTDED